MSDSLALSLSCDVHVIAGDAAGLRVVAHDRSVAKRFRDRLTIERGDVAGEWSVRDDLPSRAEGVVLEIMAPPSLALHAIVHTGSFTCHAPLRELDAKVSLGSIDYVVRERVTGPVRLNVSRGALTAVLPSVSGAFSAVGGLADVDVTLLEPGSSGELHLAAGRGTARLELPDPERASFDVVCPTGNARVPSAPRPGAVASVRIESGFGDVVVVDSTP